MSQTSEAHAKQPAQTAFVKAAVDTHEGALLRYTIRMTHDVERARDIVQEAFLRLWQADRQEVGPRLLPWLLTVCRNLAVDQHRREQHRMKHATQSTATPAPPPTTPEQQVARRDAVGRALELVNTLPENQREVILLKFEGGLSYKEISEVTGHSVSNVGYLIHVGIKQIRAQMKAQSDRRAS